MESPAWTTEIVGPAPRLCVDHMGSGELVIFLHGIGGNRTNWRDQLPAFSQSFHAVSCDCRGYGDSDDYDGPLEFSRFADDVVRLLDHFDAKKAHLVGLSMGGRIAMDVATRFSNRVSSLVLCDTHRGFSHLPDAKKQEFVRLRKEPLIKGGEPKDIAVSVAKTLAGAKAPPVVFERLVESMCRLRKDSYLKSLDATVMSDRHLELGTVLVPTLVVVGEDDRLTPPSEAKAIADGIAGAELLLIPDAGHLSNIEQPQFFNDHVIRFLRRVSIVANR